MFHQDQLKVILSDIKTSIRNLATLIQAKATIDDASVSATTTYSSTKIADLIAAAKQEAIDAASTDVIDDAAASLETTYSSTKIEGLLSAADTALRTYVDGKATTLQAGIDAAMAAAEAAQDYADGLIKDTEISTTSVWSSSKTQSVIQATAQATKDEILGGASAAYDTLKELQDELAGDQTQLDNLLTLIGNNSADLSKALLVNGSVDSSAALDALLTKGVHFLNANVTFGTTGISATTGSILVLPYADTGLFYQLIATPAGIVMRQQSALGPVWGQWMLIGGTVAAMQQYLNLGDTNEDLVAWWQAL